MPAPSPRRRLTAFAVALAVLVATPLAVVGAEEFTDVPADNPHRNDIAWLADAAVTLGCNPPANTNYCPDQPVRRDQMASFLRRLAENQVVDAATAVEAEHAATATEAENADTLDGVDSIALSTVLGAATGTFLDSTDVDLSDDETVTAAMVEITVPGPGALVVTNTSSWDLGRYVVHSWTELDTEPSCDPNYFSGAALTGSFSSDAADATVVTSGEARANMAGQAVVSVPAAGTYNVFHCFQSYTGTANNLAHALVVTWLPETSVTLASVTGQQNASPSTEGSSTR